MPVDRERVRHHLQQFDFAPLFVQELGWDRHAARLDVKVDGKPFALAAVAQKRGMVAFVLTAENGQTIPDHAFRRKIERQVARSVHEHIIIFVDADRTTQIWQWLKREPGQPAACREHSFHRGQTGEALLQRVTALAFSLEEEETLTLVPVVGRVRAALDVDRITKRFYDRFKSEHETFLGFIKGIQAAGDREWYASLMLNRLMFVYFIQKKGFLDGDPDYLRNRLAMLRQRQGKDKFLSFYRHFLLRLFHEGLGDQKRSAELDALLGRVPFLNGGLFDVHQLERDNAEITIPDKAFEKLFDFFDAYKWHLDERPLRADNEINPDVLGYIFEKYINQKQMGAYYTKEDITEYIAKNTIIPYLFDAAEKKCAIAFRQDSALWRLLRDDPDRYIYAAMRKGVIGDTGQIIALPQAVADGVENVPKRGGWNRPAADGFALPTETWREHVARRTRCLDLRDKLARGEVHSINDLVTYNLDIRQFAQDAIETCEGPELLRAFFHTIAGRVPERSNEKHETRMSVLDPACGSGAFLFAALGILEPLYTACLERMEAFVDDLDRAGDKPDVKKFADFRNLLARVDEHPSERYFVLKSIIIGNLFGVDIMEEAVEICKLRLFLKLVAQVDRVEQIEPLPDIDFNIRPGNTLVGFTSLDEVRRAFSRDDRGNMRLVTSEDEAALREIEESAEIADRAFQKFREMQTQHGMDASDFAAAKAELRKRIGKLRDELDRHLASDYGVHAGKPKAYEQWRKSHQPFHWLVEFYGIMASGGFDVIVGNPPWIEYAKVKRDYTIKNYRTESCGNLHAICTERGVRLRSPLGCVSFIVQLPIVNSSRMVSVRQLLRESSAALHVIPFADRPGKLFDGLEHSRATIWMSSCGKDVGAKAERFATSRYQRWPTEGRPNLFSTLEYARTNGASDIPLYSDQFPKYANQLSIQVFNRLKERGTHTIGELLAARETSDFVFYQEATEYWVKATVGLPYYAKNGKKGPPAHGRYLFHADEGKAQWTCALMHSSLFFVYFIAHSDCFHLNDGLVRAFPVPQSLIGDKKLMELGTKLMESLRGGAERKVIHTRSGDKIAYDEYYGWKAKPVIDKIDSVLAKHFDFTEEQLDFITSYDIKFRMGQETGENDE